MLAEYQIADRAEELARASARLAKEVASAYSTPDRPRYVAGSLGPGTKLPTLGQVSFTELRDAYEVLARGLLDGGADLLLIETCYDMLQAKAAIQACRRAMGYAGRQVPIQVQVTIELTGRMLLGTEIGAALCTLEAMKPDVIGMNCATGSGRDVRSRSVTCPAGAHSHLGAAQRRPALGRRREDALRPHARRARRAPVRLRHASSGSRCRRLLRHDARASRQGRRDLRGARTPARRSPVDEPWRPRCTRPRPSSRRLSFLVIGERTNANGSKRFRDAMLAGDWETTVTMAT